jgi:hypothetical protein
MDVMEKVRKVVLEDNTGEIVVSRAKASLPPAPSSATQTSPKRGI